MIDQWARTDCVIDRIELYRIDVETVRHFSFGSWKTRQHGFLKLSGGGMSGWGEEILALNDPSFDVSTFLGAWRALIGMSVKEALAYVKRSARQAEMAEMALIDLAGKLAGKPALELLGLPLSGSVPGLVCILDNDVDRVKRSAEHSLGQGFASHLKVKLYGDIELDCSIVRAARTVMGEDAYLVGDVNNGYGAEAKEDSVARLLGPMRKLAGATLDACEDPAMLANEHWVELQRQVGELDLIPDYPMRPAIRAIETILPGMGRVYNIHPGSAGSLFDAVSLAGRVKEIGGKLMIGDNSLIGPACTVWQQLAIGLGAEWVEAIEKPLESDAFQSSVVRVCTQNDGRGRISLSEMPHGFGIEMDEAALLRRSDGYAALQLETI